MQVPQLNMSRVSGLSGWKLKNTVTNILSSLTREVENKTHG